MANTGTITTNDGVSIAYDRRGTQGPVLLLIHGWRGSRRYFCRNVDALAAECQVVTVDLRHHGDGSRPSWGFHVARLAADIHDLLTALDLKDVTAVGTSLGAAVLWCYWELFQGVLLAGMVFVDQAPLQNRAADWQLGSKGCYDAASLAGLQAALRSDMMAFARGNAECCLTLPLPADVGALLEAETLRCDPEALAQLMADHTALDWRPVLPRITLPCLNLCGATSGCFPLAGCEYVGQHIPDCCTVVFERANHWLYLEHPEQFNQLLVSFARQQNSARAKHSVVA